MGKSAVLIVMAIFLSGCATIITGTTQKVSVTSSPSGAVAKADGLTASVTPCTFTLERKHDHTIEISKDGYRTASIVLRHTVSGALAGNAIFGGLIGAGIDAGTGAMYKLVPERVDVTLEQIEAVATEEPEQAVQTEEVLETDKAQEEIEAQEPAPAQQEEETPAEQVEQAVPPEEALQAEAIEQAPDIVEPAPAAEALPQICVKINSGAENAGYADSVRQEVEGYLVEQNNITDTGEVWMCFTLQPSGNISDLKVVDEKTTGSPEMKGQCMLAINSLYPFSPFPEGMPKEPVSIELGVISQPQN